MDFAVLDLGLIDYQQALSKQKEVFSAIKENKSPSTLIICRHHPVITLGRLAKKENILVSSSELENLGIKACQIERGGDVTYHGPGQLTAYPIFNLNQIKKDIHFFLRQLEAVAIDFLSTFKVEAQRRQGLTGVWWGEQKIASIGIAIKNWISFHGLSINIKANDLNNFGLIRPCGMEIKIVCLENILCRTFDIDQIKDNLINKFKEVF